MASEDLGSFIVLDIINHHQPLLIDDNDDNRRASGYKEAAITPS